MLLLSLFAMVLQCIQNKIQSPLTVLQKALHTLTLSHLIIYHSLLAHSALAIELFL